VNVGVIEQGFVGDGDGVSVGVGLGVGLGVAVGPGGGTVTIWVDESDPPGLLTVSVRV
jgi:hypothetical protein